MKTRRGFTLIELLVVIAIIALLIGILVPALGAARKRAQQIKCLANTSQIGKADSIFADDHKGYYPGCSGTKDDWTQDWNGAFKGYTWGSIPAWPVQLLSYVGGSRKSFKCPSAPSGDRYVDDTVRDNDYFLAAVGGDAITTGGGSTICDAINRNKIKFSSAYIMGGDCTYWEWWNYDLDIDDLGDPNYHCLSFADDLAAAKADGLDGNIYGPYHYGGVNVMYGDCHAAYAQKFSASSMTYFPDRMAKW
jgi:prepilin-type N-terminal cleavage/methylation domain-containing protein/prepilin-type processing-associated H-X9-DG protein